MRPSGVRDSGRHTAGSVKKEWRHAADAVGGRLVREDRTMVILARVAGAELRVEHYETQRLLSQRSRLRPGPSRSVTHTLVTADADAPSELRLMVSPKRALGTIPGALARPGPSFKTGDENFDLFYRSRSVLEGLARQWLDDDTRALISTAAQYTITVSKGTVSAVREGFEGDSTRLVAAMHAVAALASAGALLVLRLMELADEVGGLLDASSRAFELDGGTAISIDETGSGATIDWAWPDETGPLVTRVSAAAKKPTERFHLYSGAKPEVAEGLELVEELDQELKDSYWVRSSDPRRTARRLAGDMASRVLELDPEAILAEGDAVSVHLAGFEDDPDWLLRAADLCGDLGVSRGG